MGPLAPLNRARLSTTVTGKNGRMLTSADNDKVVGGLETRGVDDIPPCEAVRGVNRTWTSVGRAAGGGDGGYGSQRAAHAGKEREKGLVVVWGGE